jgi:parvulin-like peptidyl-prolyl isomerase
VKAEKTHNILNTKSLVLALLSGGMLLCTQMSMAANPVVAQSSSAPKKVPVFATVGDDVITWREYRRAYLEEARNKFFHGTPDDNTRAAFQRTVGNKLVNDVLLTQEAKRRKLKPDSAFVDQKIQKYDRKFAKDPKWLEARKRVVPILTKRFENESLPIVLERVVRNVPQPTIKQLKEYFDAYPDKFTSPPQPKVSVILIRVDPSSTTGEWNKAKEEAEGLVKRLRAGEDFATMAKNYSGDITAEDGGDMGYLHAGMLPGLPEQTVSKLQPGDTSDPVRLLEGMAIFRLTDRLQPPPLNFEASQQRAKELWLQEQGDIAWDSLKEKLRSNTTIHIDESRFLPLGSVAETPAK